MSLNKVILIGHVGQEPQVRTVGENKVASFTLATTEKFRGKDGNVVENTEWHNVTVWGRQADVVERYVNKGTHLYIEGKIKTEKYTDKEGNDRYATKIYANSLQLLGGKKEETPHSPAPAQKTQQKPQTTAMPYPTEVDDSDLPF